MMNTTTATAQTDWTMIAVITGIVIAFLGVAVGIIGGCIQMLAH